MSSLSGESREARIAEIERLRVEATTRGTWSRWEIGDAIANQLPWLISELRDALTREAALQKDAERYAVAFAAAADGIMQKYGPDAKPTLNDRIRDEIRCDALLSVARVFKSLPQHPSSKENETPEHVCGLQGFGRGVDGMYDDCPACSHASKIRSLPHD